MGVRAIGSTVDDLSAAQDLPDLGSDPVSMQAFPSAIDCIIISQLGGSMGGVPLLLFGTVYQKSLHYNIESKGLGNLQ